MNRLHLVLSATLILILSLCFTGVNEVASAATMQKIQQRGYLTVAVKDNLRPLGFRDEKGNLQGLEIDLARKLATDLLGKAEAVEFQPVLNSDRLPAVFNHQVDLAIAQITATESRSRIVSFSVPYYYDGAAVVTKNTSIQNFQDFKQRKIGVLNNSSTIGYIRYFIPNADLVGVNSYLQGKEQIENNQIDGFAADISVLSGWVEENPEYQILATKLSTQPLSVATPKGLQYDELRRKVNEAIARYTATGWLKERGEYWGLE
ncbi:MAG: transporter substrate-binding domain-containing protein [Sphaerospermopsis sp. SIO1G2]|nr:transporter substrate-binding domain-containing protein [Sphaerospermopsis sp. SIO1G1]NET69662.1 transporter substrate-binding domain-containing protein [Sphaerospermopsis sp. SIO1G2]